MVNIESDYFSGTLRVCVISSKWMVINREWVGD